ncbi:alkaline phosphatase-like [Saccostrea echinata]|uniref:alkaline phosphatase-like n=1 Tax=Saccostrea echinata TaxID=191078 RepID=UPI002A7EDFDE|nr:alkaline phosphatase-like [Saccostrea echinata]
MLLLAVVGLICLVQDVVGGGQRAAHTMFDKAKYSGNGETRYFWRNEAQNTLQNSLKNQPIVGVAKNVIMFLGDGMGVSTVTAGRILKGQLQNKTGEETVLSWERFPNVALSKTYNQDHQTPDSAGTATAYLCGVKSNMGTIGVDAQIVRGHCDTTQAAKITSILDWSLAQGKSVGVVTTTRVTHATPAGTYANVADRNWEGDAEMTHVTGGCKDIARQLVEDNPDIQVIMGGGRRFFLPADATDPERGANTAHGRKDGKNLIEDWMNDKKRRHKTFRYVWNETDFNSVDPAQTDFLLGLFESSHMNFEIDRTDPHYEKAGEPHIKDMTEKAIQILSKNPKGYFLLVEGGKIDLAHHGSEPVRSLHDVVAMDLAVEKANSITNEKDTLIVVTADHSHTFVISGYPVRGNGIFDLMSSRPGYISLARDHNPYTTLLYGNGPGAHSHRPDLRHVDTTSKHYVYQSAIPLSTETHGGEDVAIFARGPMAHLLLGVREQNYIPHVMAYASCVGDYHATSQCAASAGQHSTATSNIFG